MAQFALRVLLLSFGPAGEEAGTLEKSAGLGTCYGREERSMIRFAYPEAPKT